MHWIRIVSTWPLALALAGCALLAPAPAERPPERLGREAVPQHYRLDLTVLPGAERLAGSVAISVRLAEARDRILLHGKDLDVSAARFMKPDGRVWPARYTQLNRVGIAQLAFDEAVPAGDGLIEISYTAPLNESLEGLYKVREQGRDYLFSQFQVTSARLLFPGFDEPGFKTPFAISVTTDAGHVVIGNMPIAESEPLGDGLKRARFATTPPLPTYLLALAIGPLDVVAAEDIPPGPLRERPVPLRGVATRGKGPKLTHALGTTAGLLQLQEDYFGRPYPYPKLDLIAAPDFNFGAMENVGAIVYRELYLLLDEQAPLKQKRGHAIVHAHELAHQWFGNLVTPAWWDDTWLNESFATWMAYKTVAAWNPDGGYGRETLRDALHAMEVDALATTRQVRQPIASHDDIANAFDSITYDKGGGVLAMFESYLGEPAFRAGVRTHLERFAHATADAHDFMQSLADGSGQPDVVPAFRSFIEQPGVPRVDVTLECAGAPTLRLSQRRYAPLGSSIGTGQRWQIPVCLRLLDSGRKQCVLLSQPVQDLALEGDACPAAVLPNANGAGYYRFNLDAAQWTALLQRSDQLQPAELLALVDSLDAAFRAGEIDIAPLAEAARRLAEHPDWDVASAPLSRLVVLLDSSVDMATKPAMRRWLRDTYGPRAATLGLDARDGESVDVTLLRRALVATLAVDARDLSLRARLAARARSYIGDPADPAFDAQALPPDLVRAALRVAVADSDPALGRALLAQLDRLGDELLRGHIIEAAARAPALAAEVRALALGPTLRGNELRKVLRAQFDEPALREEAWAWLRENFDAIVARTPDWSRGRLIHYASSFCSSHRRDEVEAFFAPRQAELSGGPRQLAQTLESIELCTALRQHAAPELDRYFTPGS